MSSYLAAEKSKIGSHRWQHNNGKIVEEVQKLKFPGKPYSDTVETHFADLLKRECMAVVKASYFEKCLDKGV